MGLFNRSKKLPADRRPPLERDERVLAWAPVAVGDGTVVVTNLGLWLPAAERRLGWHEVHKAIWSGRELAITAAEQVAERDGYLVMGDRPVDTFELPEPGAVPAQVRLRVTGSVFHTVHHPLPGGGVRIAARRAPGVDGVTWTVRYDPGTRTDDPEIVAETDRMVRAAQEASALAD
ncbi:hypothetical protein ACK8GG_19920 [Micromonosporaceae bacterium DT55]|uniref:hypothetical protein n=1 Tax=Melissospora conviva TaxID=3388432 RepID=UPI003C25E270